MLSNFLLVTGYLFAQAQATFILNNPLANQTEFLNISNLVASGEGGIDPRFSATFQKGEQDLFDTSTYMSGLSLMYKLSYDRFGFRLARVDGVARAMGH